MSQVQLEIVTADSQVGGYRIEEAMGSDPTCIIEFLRKDHKSLEALMGRLDSIPEHECAEFLQELEDSFTRHERAEDFVFYPAIREYIPDGHTIANAYRTESSHAESTLSDLMRADHRAMTTRYALQDFCHLVIAHQKHEENDPIELLESRLDLEERITLGGCFQLAKQSAPTNRINERSLGANFAARAGTPYAFRPVSP